MFRTVTHCCCRADLGKWRLPNYSFFACSHSRSRSQSFPYLLQRDAELPKPQKRPLPRRTLRSRPWSNPGDSPASLSDSLGRSRHLLLRNALQMHEEAVDVQTYQGGFKIDDRLGARTVHLWSNGIVIIWYLTDFGFLFGVGDRWIFLRDLDGSPLSISLLAV